MRQSHLYLYTLICTLALISISPTGVAAIEYGGYGGRPAFPDPSNTRTDSIFIFTLSPGENKDDGIRVINNSNETKTFTVYTTDSTPSTGGAFACEQFSEGKDSVGSWITLSQAEVTIAAGRNEIMPFHISIPETASVGEHNGCILIQEKKSAGTQESGVNISMRMGLRVVVTVPGEIIRDLELGDFTVTSTGQSILMTPEVTNKGNVSIDTDISVTTKGLFSIDDKEYGGIYPVLPGETSSWNFEVPPLFWGGWYIVHAGITYDDDSSAAIGVDSGKEKTRVEWPTERFFSPPQPAALAIELIAILSILSILIYSITNASRRRQITKNWIKYTVTDNTENIGELAHTLGVPWKLLTQVNHLKPPYTLKRGDTLKIPSKNHSSHVHSRKTTRRK